MKLTTAAALALAGSSALAFEYEDASQDVNKVVEWSKTLASLGEEQFQAKFGNNKSRYASPDFWGDHSVYQIFIDRFNNGDASNDNANLPNMQKDQLASGNLYDVHGYRHGGDLKGITNRLDYIKDLGMGVLWLTPIFQNLGGDYHGYCVSDFLKVDPGFGSLEDLQELVDEAHKRDIRVVLDVVVNHMCDPNTAYARELSSDEHYACSDSQNWRNWNDDSGGISGQGELNFGDSFFKPLKTNHFFNRCGPNSLDDMQGTGTAAVYGDFVRGMYDFDTNNYDFQRIFTNIHKYWIAATDLDGFRLDAAKHITSGFVSHFSPQVRDYADSIGKNDFFLVGEIAADQDWQGRFLGKQYLKNVFEPSQGTTKAVPWRTTQVMEGQKELYLKQQKQRYPGLTSVYDFAHGGTAREVLRFEKDPMQLEQYLYGPGYDTINSQQDGAVFWNNIEIHDWPRFLAGNLKNNAGAAMSAQAYLTFARGIPIVYYGAEQGYNGDCHHNSIRDVGAAKDSIIEKCSGHDHALYRQTMWEGAGYNLGSAFGEQNAFTNIGRPAANPANNWENDKVLNRDQPLYKLMRAQQMVRNSCVALRRGFQVFRWVASDLIAFSRVYYDKEVIVLLNPSDFTEITIPRLAVDGGVNQAAGQRYKNLFNGFEVATTVDDWGMKLDFNGMKLKPHQFMVFVHEFAVGDWNEYYQAHECNAFGQKVATADELANPPAAPQPVMGNAAIVGAAVGGCVVAVGAAVLGAKKMSFKKQQRQEQAEKTEEITNPTFEDL